VRAPGIGSGVSVEPIEIAEEAGLHYADLDRPGIVRRRRGKGFSYHGPRGGAVDERTKRRIDELVIPPAWEDVWISADPDSHVLATGVDEAGRRQYRYHPEFRHVADGIKFARVGLLADKIADVRVATRDALASDDERTRLIGVVVRLIDRTLMRVGTERYADEHESFGASTLRCEHATVNGHGVTLCFTGKSGKEQTHAVDDEDLFDHIRRRRRRYSGTELLFATEDGWTVDGTVVGDWLSEVVRFDVSAKDLRTLGASSTMVHELMDPTVPPGDRDPLVVAYDVVAERLGNTRTIARDSYVAPRVVEAYEDGDLARHWSASRTSSDRTREESTLAKLLAE
jgi:DNA topoisomerase-1